MDRRRLSDTINIGVADCFFTPEGSNIPIYLGLSQGGMQLNYNTEWHTITSDQTGSTPLEDVLIGETVVIEGNILDTSKSKIATIFPTASAEGDEASPTAVTFGSRPGRRATHSAGMLLIRPVSMRDDRSLDVTIYRTTNSGNLELAYQLDQEWILACEFKGYYDDRRREGDRLFRMGENNDTSVEENRRVINFWITPSNPEVSVGEIIDFRANAMFEDGNTEDVTDRCTWISSTPTTASLTQGVGNNGLPVQRATALSTGSTVIRAEFIGFSNSTSMLVN